jgi:hypothetical protein
MLSPGGPLAARKATRFKPVVRALTGLDAQSPLRLGKEVGCEARTAVTVPRSTHTTSLTG